MSVFWKKTLCLCMGVLLFLGGIGFGAYRGWQQEYETLMALSQEEQGLDQFLLYLGADASNLLAVAHRHLPDTDPQVSALQQSAQILLFASVEAKLPAFSLLSDQAYALQEQLKQQDSFQQSQRDQVYLSTLLRDIATLKELAYASAYNHAAKDYNQRMESSFTGKLSKALGGKKALLFQQSFQ
ncbi:MAG: hypothetical protein GX786_09460 [Clostridiales bacterium]|nr:hypothetical protein [Clostridiales bacterium]